MELLGGKLGSAVRESNRQNPPKQAVLSHALLLATQGNAHELATMHVVAAQIILSSHVFKYTPLSHGIC